MANLTQTTINAACAIGAGTISVASATGISAPSGGFMQKLYIIDPNHTRGELVGVIAVNGTQITIARLDEFRNSHLSGSIVLIAPIDPLQGGFFEFNPNGSPATNPNLTQPWVNVTTGEQWLWSTLIGQWVPGWNNPTAIKGPTAAVASAAGVVLPTGPLFHMTGTLAVTGFTIPVGFAGGRITVIPDGVFTWTAAGNIGLAGTAVVSKALEFVWDSNAGLFYPSYIA